jgi:hypothetical protein
MTPEERKHYVELRVAVFVKATKMMLNPDDDCLWREWRRESDEVEALWERHGTAIAADQSIEDDVHRRISAL